jgi:AsmA protein
LSSASLRRFANWLGSPIGPGSTLGQASLFGTAEFSNRVLSVADAELTLDGNSASGALGVTAAERPDITGTLAFESLDLTPYFAGLATALSTASDWRKVKLPTEWFRDMNADIRLSANSVKLGSLLAGNTAASASLRDARLEIGVARADLDGGSLAGDLAIAAGSRPLVEAQLRATDIDLASAAPVLGLPKTISGSGSLVVDVATGGLALGELVDGMNGTARLDVRQGAVPVFGIANLAAESGLAADPGPMENLVPIRVDAASAGFTFAGGVAVLERGKFTTPSYSADAQGWVGLSDGTLGLNGMIRASSGGRQEATAGAEPTVAPDDGAIAFTVEGSLAQPLARLLELPD